jgi:hypothetical protein
MYITQIYVKEPKVNTEKMKKKPKQMPSYHRENKTGAHSTIGGLGIVARVYGRR